MFNKSIAFAAAIALSTSAVSAGGLSPEIIEATPEEVVSPAPSVNPAYIVMGVLAAMLIIAAIDGGDDDEPDDDDQCAPQTGAVSARVVIC